jgi:hypothetical protein
LLKPALKHSFNYRRLRDAEAPLLHVHALHPSL